LVDLTWRFNDDVGLGAIGPEVQVAGTKTIQRQVRPWRAVPFAVDGLDLLLPAESWRLVVFRAVDNGVDEDRLGVGSPPSIKCDRTYEGEGQRGCKKPAASKIKRSIGPARQY